MQSKILIVDDDPHSVVTLESILNGQGYQILSAESGASALEKAEGIMPDLILLDVMMPGMDGPSILQALRNLPDGRAWPVVFMTAKVQPQEVAHYKQLGAIDVIPKPFDPMGLADKVRAIWGRRHD